MNGIYHVTVRGRQLESRDLRKLLARAVVEKRIMDQRLRLFANLRRGAFTGSGPLAAGSLCAGEASMR